VNERNLVGKCGLYCGACGIYRAQRDSEEWRGRIASKYNCGSDQVRCNGCGDLTSECWGNGCKIVLCTRAKGVDYCHECREYQSDNCEKFRDLSSSYLKAGVDLKNNLTHIKEGRIEEWLQESQKKFTCKSCGKPVAVWNTNCHHCGDEIKR
jgi:hypothetical protein